MSDYDEPGECGDWDAWELPLAVQNAAQPLTIILARYPILENLVSFLRPDDIVALTTTSQAIREHVRMYDGNAKANLLKKTLCPGLGLEMRLANHCRCKTRGWHQTFGCGGEGFDAVSRPCIECGINTCNECRTHVVYQSYVEDPGVDKHRWWAGIFLDQPLSFAVYPPKNADQAASWHLPLDLLKPQHDQGRIHIPLHIDAIADPEPLHRILDMNLGRGYITPKGRTTLPYDGNHLMMMINNQARKRKEMVCPSCFDEIRKMEPKPEPCSCTFRKRYLDRWICFPCFMKEEIELEASLVKQYEVEEVGPMHYHLKSWKCRCGVAMMVGDEPSAVCNWCRGPIVGDEAANEDEATGDTKNEDSQLNEDENAGPEPENLPADIMGMVKNKDGSMSVWLNGERIHGESLSREMVVKFAIAHGEDVGCSCCHCHHRVQGYQHVHDHEEEQEEAGDSDSDDTMSEEDDDMADDDDDDNDDDEMADEDEEEYGDMPSLEQMGVMFDLDEMEADVD